MFNEFPKLEEQFSFSEIIIEPSVYRAAKYYVKLPVLKCMLRVRSIDLIPE